jgi:hypothetical protein
MQYLDEYLLDKDYSKDSVLVSGGSVMLLNDLYEAPFTNFHISSNHHNLIMLPDMVVALDKHTIPILEGYRGLKCGKYDEANIHIGMCPSFGFSGAAAVWLADYMGFGTVLIAGYSCYLDKGKSYWHHEPSQSKKPHVSTTEAQQRIIWDMVRCSMKNPDRVRVMSGFLQKIFKPWRKNDEYRKVCAERERRCRPSYCYHGGRCEPSERPS